jgi:hypothetical protein
VDRSLREIADLATPMTLRVAATLGLIDMIADGAATAEKLAAQTATSPAVLARVFVHPRALGVLSRVGGYRVTELGRGLRSDAPGDRRAELDANGAIGRAALAFVDLLETVTSGEPACLRPYGQDFGPTSTSSPRCGRRSTRG